MKQLDTSSTLYIVTGIVFGIYAALGLEVLNTEIQNRILITVTVEMDSIVFEDIDDFKECAPLGNLELSNVSDIDNALTLLQNKLRRQILERPHGNLTIQCN